MIEEIYEILFQFGGGKGGEPGNVAVRFLLPTFFWGILALVAFREWKREEDRKDLYVGIAAIIGMLRELIMFVAEYGGWRGYVSFDILYRYYPPFEHAATMFSGVFIAASFLSYLQVSERFVRSFFLGSSAITGLLYVTTAPAWQNLLREQPGISFGLFWGDLAFRIAASIFMGTVVATLLLTSQKGKYISKTMIIGFTFLFLDEFLMIFNIISRERYVQYFAPLRHNLHIWSIPLFAAFYWTDLTRRMEAAEQIINNSFRLSPSMLCVFDQKGQIRIASPAAEQIIGMPSDSLSGQDIRRVCIPLGQADQISRLTEDRSFEQKCSLSDGSVKWLSWNVHYSPEDSHYYAVISDATPQKQAEEQLSAALEESETERAKTEAIIAAIGDGISIQDRSFRIVYQNSIYRDQVGDHIGEFCYQAYAKQDRICPGCPVYQSFMDGRIHTVQRQIAADNGHRIYEITVSPLKDRSGSVAAGIQVIRDITERKALDRDLAKKEKIDSLGVLAGGIAHDFNNLLTAILGNIALAERKADRQDALSNLKEAEKAAVRAKDLVQQILTFASGGEPVRKSMHLEQLVRDACGRALRGSRSACNFEIADDLFPAEIDGAQISQAVASIVSNADQAMPDGGVITVACRNIGTGDDLPLSLPADKRYSLIRITDTGTGIPEEHMQRIFEPYFTTKPGGAGLGLSAAHSIITKHGGLITADSLQGAGSVFSIYLPASESKVITSSETVGNVPGKVLIMDDEESVRELSGEILTSAGFTVAYARDGREAVELYGQALSEGEPFDAVVLDLTIPGGMGGRQALERLMEIDPGVRAIVSSGYSNDAVMADHKTYGFCGMVAKPYMPDDLCNAVSQAVRERIS